MALALYGVVRGGHPIGGPPVDEARASRPLSVVESDGLAVVATEVDEDYAPIDEDAVAHLDVVSALVLDGPVLPFRFGTVAPDADSVREEVLDARGDELRDLLDALDGLVEVRVDVGFDAAADLAVAAAEDPVLFELAAQARSGGPGFGDQFGDQLQLGEQVLARLTAWWQARADELLAPLQQLATRSTRLTAAEAHQVRTAFLVPRDRLADVDAVLARLPEGAPSAPVVSAIGPLPAYSFLDELDLSPRPGPSHWGW